MKKIIQKEIHGSIVNIVNEDTQPWLEGDGMITCSEDLALIVYGADCAMIAFWDGSNNAIGICHAGWRGLTQGIIKKMKNRFIGGFCYIGPLLHSFEIQKNECFEAITSYGYSDCISNIDGKYIFDFNAAILRELEGLSISGEMKNTIDHPEIASWRRSQKRGNGTQNRLVIWKTKGHVYKEFFLPNQEISFD